MPLFVVRIDFKALKKTVGKFLPPFNFEGLFRILQSLVQWSAFNHVAISPVFLG